MSIRALNWARRIFSTLDVPPRERLVLLAYCYHHNDKTGECYPSYDTVAEFAGYSRRRVIEATGNLADNGLVFPQKRRVSGHQGSNHVALFGIPSGKKWRSPECHRRHPARVTDTAPCESDTRVTQGRVTPASPDREELNTRGKQVELRVLAGGRHA